MVASIGPFWDANETWLVLGIGLLLVAFPVAHGINTSGDLQRKAVTWGRRFWWGALAGFVAVSAASPLVSERIFEKWFSLPFVVLLAPLPIITLALLLIAARALHRLPVRLAQGNEYGAWVPFACTIGVIVLGFYGLSYSLFPYLVIDHINIWEAASAHESLMFILVGALVVLPAIAGYTIYVYRVFRGKAGPLSYG